MGNSGADANALNRPIRLLGAMLVVGLVGGAATSLLAFFLARYGPAGDGWSFRGNGALAAYTVLPALLAAGWTALVLRYKNRPDWSAIGSGAGIIGLLLAGIDAALLPVFGRDAERDAGGVLLLGLAAWALIAPVLSWAILRSGPGRPTAAGTHLAGAALWLAGLAAGLVVLGIALPAGS